MLQLERPVKLAVGDTVCRRSRHTAAPRCARSHPIAPLTPPPHRTERRTPTSAAAHAAQVKVFKDPLGTAPDAGGYGIVKVSSATWCEVVMLGPNRRDIKKADDQSWRSMHSELIFNRDLTKLKKRLAPRPKWERFDVTRRCSMRRRVPLDLNVFKRQLLSDTRFELLEWACAEVGRGASTPLTKHVCNVKLDRVREVLDDLLPQGDVSGIAD